MPASKKAVYLIYSPCESARSDGSGFWSNDDGWGTLNAATLFSADEIARMNLPIATGRDAQAVPWSDASRHHEGARQCKRRSP
ncbi:hypothetical protein [Burkholderia cepacia]|uniref:hypothetical protein n=1 Tax=Burkholderia cepacia TaxID=292 RepID=UPI00158CD2B5|nr:hypothetical protein [Burkholderia cepacia]